MADNASGTPSQRRGPLKQALKDEQSRSKGKSERRGQPWKPMGIAGFGDSEKSAGDRPGCGLEGHGLILGFTLRLFCALKCCEVN